MNPDHIIDEILHERARARSRFPPFNTAHEGYAVLKEEVDELWDEIKHKPRNAANLRIEAVQVAAMAICFIEECT